MVFKTACIDRRISLREEALYTPHTNKFAPHYIRIDVVGGKLMKWWLQP